MTLLTIPYCIFLVLFGLFTTFLLLSSSHHVDLDFLIINCTSLAILPLTAYFLLSTTFRKGKYINSTFFLLTLTGLIFCYYTYDLFKEVNSIKDLTLFTFIPLIALILTVLFAIKIIKSRQV